MWTTVLILFSVLISLASPGSLLWFKQTFNKWNPACYALMLECCFHPRSYKPNLDTLERAFAEHLFGQHLAHSTIAGAIQGHVNAANPPKALVLSLHGPAGTGKNHISRLLVDSLFAYGLESSFVSVGLSTKDYPHHDEVSIKQYKEKLVQLVTSKVSSCPHHVFIFDEIENMPPGLLDSIKVFLDYHEMVDGVNYHKAIFIFRSNLAATEINNYAMDVYERGRKREDIKLAEMEKLITNSVFHNAGAGLYKAKIIDSYLVSHFVPFLPLEVSHVRQCIRAEFQGSRAKWTAEMVEEVLSELNFNGPQGARVFALKGCKNVAEKVNIVLYKHKSPNDKRAHEGL